MLDLQRNSPLRPDVRLFSAAGFQLREVESVTKLRIQVLRPRGMHVAAVDPNLLPDRPNSTSGVDPIALWKAPDDWLVYSQTLTSEAMSSVSWSGAWS